MLAFLNLPKLLNNVKRLIKVEQKKDNLCGSAVNWGSVNEKEEYPEFATSPGKQK